MLFQGLNKLRSRSIMNSIILMAFGIILIIFPDEYAKILIDVLGSVLLIISIVLIFNFLSSQRSLMDFVFLTVALVLAIAGIYAILYDLNTLHILSLLFGGFLLIDGIHGVIHSLVFARRSGRKGWWIMVLLSISLIVLGLIIFNNPWWDTLNALLNSIGWVLLFSSLVSALRLIWVWPIKSE